MLSADLLQNLAIALGLGLLVGLQRQWTLHEIAGIRTFPLITILGTLCAALGYRYGGAVIAAGFIAVTAILFQDNFLKWRQGEQDLGITTEMAGLVMYAVGALLVMQQTAAAVATGGAVAVLLYYKKTLHEGVRRIDEAEFRALMRLVVIGLLILPVLPNENYGPYEVLNPFKIWLMVVLIVGISLGAYVSQRLLGPRVGTILGGILGGLVSSTAATVSYARKSKENHTLGQAAALVIYIASTIVFVRVLFEIGIVARHTLPQMAPPLTAMLLIMAAVAAVFYLLTRHKIENEVEQEPPKDLKAAVIFALMYAVVLIAVAWTKERYGEGALYGVAALSGMTDMDAITLSTAQLAGSEGLPVETAWRVILVGGLSNIVFKGGVVAFLGSRRLLAQIALLFALTLALGAALIWLWPDAWVQSLLSRNTP